MSYQKLYREARKRQIEQHLRQIGCKQCSVCQLWMNMEFVTTLNDKDICLQCKEESNANKTH